MGIRAGQQTLFVMSYEEFYGRSSAQSAEPVGRSEGHSLTAASTTPPAEFPDQPHDSSPLEDPKS
jgi:hypothetical protein